MIVEKFQGMVNEIISKWDVVNFNVAIPIDHMSI